MSDISLESRIAAIRAFSRFYTRRIGVLHEGLLGSAFSLAEGRVIWELAQTELTTATALIATLDLDAGYLSRILRGLEQRGIVTRRPSTSDARQSEISLTSLGRDAYRAINDRSHDEIAAMLARLAPVSQDRLVDALRTAKSLLASQPSEPPVIVRAHRAGEIGWIIHRQAVLYADEYGLDASFEALLAEIGAKFLRDFNPAREACWIAERDGTILGSVSLVKQTETVAKLRMLYVEAAARGLGLGRRLVHECIAFARRAGYRKVTLWTNDVLIVARAIYVATGFRLVASEPPALAFGRVMGSETWELDLEEGPA